LGKGYNGGKLVLKYRLRIRLSATYNQTGVYTMAELELAKVIEALRRELCEAKLAGAGESIRFNVNSIDIEFETVVKYGASGEAGSKIRFFVLDVDAKGKAEYGNATTQKIKLNLQVVDKDTIDSSTGEPAKAQIGGDGSAPALSGKRQMGG
jgi:hypothetical protein